MQKPRDEVGNGEKKSYMVFLMFFLNHSLPGDCLGLFPLNPPSWNVNTTDILYIWSACISVLYT